MINWITGFFFKLQVVISDNHSNIVPSLLYILADINLPKRPDLEYWLYWLHVSTSNFVVCCIQLSCPTEDIMDQFGDDLSSQSLDWCKTPNPSQPVTWLVKL